jgi:acetylornithine deacetylase/succinyl-diaminopimelate desuccinylase-like protein
MKKVLVPLFMIIIAIALTAITKSSDLSLDHFPFKRVQLDKKLQESLIPTTIEYLKIKTIRSNEGLAAQFFKKKFDEAGVKTRLIDIPGHDARTILVAEMGQNIEGRKGVVLSGHADVVEADASEWKADPFGAKVINNSIYARGAIDMKSVSIFHLFSMLALKKELIKTGATLKRKIMFLLVPGEESGGIGAKYLVENKKEIFKGYSYLINEGAFFTKDIVSKGLRIANIQYAEKGVLWFNVNSSGKSGHGSVPTPDYAVIKLLNFIDALQSHFSKRMISDEMQMMFHQIGKKTSGVKGFVLKRTHIPLFQNLLKETLNKSKHLNAMTKNTVSITGLSTIDSLGMNVIGSQASAKIDMRILPSFRADDVENKVREIAAKTGVSIEVVQKTDATKSELNSRFFNSLAVVSQSLIKGSTPSPLMSQGATDSLYFRKLGLNCYGFVPIILSAKQLSTMHGVDEHISIDNLKLGSQIMSTLVRYWALESEFK